MSLLADPLDQALGTTSKIRVLRLLVNQERTLSAREVARLTGMSLPPVLKSLRDLSALGVIVREETPGQLLCRANRDHLLVRTALGPLFAAEAEWTAGVFTRVRAALTADVVAAWFFGSAARGEDSPVSDLDLFVLAASEPAADRIREALAERGADWRRELGADLRPVVMTVDAARAQRAAGNPLLLTAVRDARLVTGVIPKELAHGSPLPRPSRR